MFGVVPKTLWDKKLAADERNRIPLGFNCYILETGDHTILIDTGAGDKLNERARERMKLPAAPSPLHAAITEAAIDPEKIDIVVNTHLHFDHCGGNTVLTNGSAKPAFPTAVYYTRLGEWEHAHERHIRDRISYIDANYDPLVESGQMRLIGEDMEVVPGVRLELASGHNRDMMIVKATSRGETFCLFADLIPTIFHLDPAWIAAFDLFPLEAIDNKIRLLNQACKENWICGFGHDPEVAFTRVQENNGKYEAVPISQRAVH